MARDLGQAVVDVVERAPELRRNILWVLVVAIPVAFVRITADPFGVPKLALLTIGVASVLALRITEILQGRSWRGLDLLLIPVLLMTVPLVVSLVLSPYTGWAILGLNARFQGLLPYLLVFLLGILVADAFRGRGDELAFALIWAGAIVGGYAVVQTVALDPFEWSLYGAPTRAVSTLGNPNFTGGFLGIVLPIGIATALTDAGRRRVVVRLLVFVVAGWLAARSQGGWAAGVAGSAIVAGYALRDRFTLSHIAGWLLAFLVAAVTVGVVLVAMVRPESRFTTGAAVDRSGWSKAAFGMGLASPVAGRGPNSFAIEGVRYRPLEDALEFNFDFPDDPHSVPMSMFANLGSFGLIGFLGVLAWAVWFFWRIDQPTLLQVAFTGAVFAYFVQSLVSIDELSLRLGLWTALGGLVAASSSEPAAPRPASRAKTKARRRSKTPPTRLKAPAAVAGVGIALILCTAWAVSLLAADVLVRQGSSLFVTGDVEGGRAKYAAALALRDSVDYRGRLGLVLKDLAFREQGKIDRELVRAADEAFSFTEEVPYLFSIVSRARLLHSASVTESGREEALSLYRSAMEIDPLNPLLRLETAVVLRQLDRHQEAFELLSAQKEEVGHLYPQYWGALALEAAEVGEVEVAREALDVAISLDPVQPDAVAAQELLGID